MNVPFSISMLPVRAQMAMFSSFVDEEVSTVPLPVMVNLPLPSFTMATSAVEVIFFSARSMVMFLLPVTTMRSSGVISCVSYTVSPFLAAARAAARVV